jgi:predicted transglutaminase-like cysteine proteinase
MLKCSSRPVLALLGLCSALSLGACSSIPQSTFMALGAERPAPIAYLDFCQREPGDCAHPAADAAPAEAVLPRGKVPASFWMAAFGRTSATGAAPGERLVMTQALWQELSTVNLKLNGEIHQQDDAITFGRNDVWTLPPVQNGQEVGDCKDIALAKRRELVARGLPASALAITIVHTRGGRSHAVLTVTTDKGDYVLDSLTPWVSPWRSLNYTWIERQMPEQIATWYALTGSDQHAGS